MKSKILGLLAAGLLAGPMAAHAGNVVVGDRAWRQVTETVSLSWNQVATVCNTSTGVCSGSLGAVSFDGWIWASIDDVAELWDVLILPGSQQFAPPSAGTSYIATNSADIDAFISSSMFLPTIDSSSQQSVWGMTRTLTPPGLFSTPRARSPTINDKFSPTALDEALMFTVNGTNDALNFFGFWMYRSVPEPGTLALLGLGLLGLGITRRKAA